MTLAIQQCSRGGQPRYSDLAITMCLTLGMVYRLPLRQTQGLMPDLLNQIGTPVSRFIADGAYDGAPTSDLLKARFGEAVEIIIPPPKNAIPSPQSKCFPSLRDRHIVKIQTHGRMAWQSGSGYNQRSRIETQMGRWKAIIGPKLKARCFENQQTEAKIGVAILNKMTELGRPVFKQIS